MQKPSFQFWQKWLTWANVITLIVGLLAAFAGNSIFFSMHNATTEELFFQEIPLEGPILEFKNWLFGIIGATIIGFHTLMIMISENAFKKKERWSYYALWIGLLSWFVIDTSISAFYGAFHNIWMINLVAFVLIGLPLIMTGKDFKRN